MLVGYMTAWAGRIKLPPYGEELGHLVPFALLAYLWPSWWLLPIAVLAEVIQGWGPRSFQWSDVPWNVAGVLAGIAIARLC